MSVADLAVRIVYEETDDPETLYTIPFQFLAADQVQVSRSIDGGAFTVLTAGYAVAGDGRAAPPTGTVQLTEPVEGASLAIARVTPREQPVTFTDRGDFPHDMYQDHADRTIMAVQEQDAQLGRAIMVPVGSEGLALDPADFVGAAIGVNAEGDAFVPLVLGENEVDVLETLAQPEGASLVKTASGRALSQVLAGLPQVFQKPRRDVETIDVDGDSFSLTSYPHDTSGQPIPVKVAAELDATITTRATSGHTSADIQYGLFSTGTVLRAVPASESHLGIVAAGHNDVIHLSTGGDRAARIAGLARILLANYLWKAKAAGTNKVLAGAASSGQRAVAGTWTADPDLPGAFIATTAEAAQQATFTNCRYGVAWYKVKIGSDGMAALRFERDDTNLEIFSAAPEAGWVPTNISKDWAVEARWFDAGEVLPELLMQFKVHSSTGGGDVSFLGFAGYSGLIEDDQPMLGVTDVSRWPAAAFDAVSGSPANMRVVNKLIRDAMGVAAKLGAHLIKLPMASVIGPSFGLVGGTNFHYDEDGALACTEAWLDALDSPAPFAGTDLDAILFALLKSGGFGSAPGLPLAFDEAMRLVVRRLAGSALELIAADNQVRMEAGIYFVPEVDGEYDVANAVLLQADGVNGYLQARKGRLLLKGETGNGVSAGAAVFRAEDDDTTDLGGPSNKWKTVQLGAGGVKVSGTKVVGAQGAAVADAAGGATVDAEARTALNALLARARAHGLIEP